VTDVVANINVSEVLDVETVDDGLDAGLHGCSTAVVVVVVCIGVAPDFADPKVAGAIGGASTYGLGLRNLVLE